MGDLLGSPQLVAKNKAVSWKPFGGPKRTILCQGRRGVTSGIRAAPVPFEMWGKPY